MMVEPSMRAIDTLYTNLNIAVTEECMPVVQAVVSFTLTISRRVEQPAVRYIHGALHEFPLGHGYAVPDFVAQDVSFRAHGGSLEIKHSNNVLLMRLMHRPWLTELSWRRLRILSDDD